VPRIHDTYEFMSSTATAAPAITVTTFDPAIPRQHQVYLQLKQEIADAVWEGRTFPGEQELARRFGVSVITSRGALTRLVGDGWIERGRGRGTRVVFEPARMQAPAGPPMFPVGGHRPYDYRVLFADVRTAPGEACGAFGVALGSQLWQCSRLRSYEGRPHSVTHNAQLVERGRRHTARRLATLPMGLVFEAEGIQFGSLRRRMSVTHAPAGVAEHLGLTLADPVLVTTFTVHDPADELLEWVRIYVHPDEPGPEERLDLRAGAWSSTERS
jgi:GntR family transcriptional regulator